MLNRPLKTTPRGFLIWAAITLILIVSWGALHGLFLLPDSICYPVAVLLGSISGIIFIVIELINANGSDQ